MSANPSVTSTPSFFSPRRHECFPDWYKRGFAFTFAGLALLSSVYAFSSAALDLYNSDRQCGGINGINVALLSTFSVLCLLTGGHALVTAKREMEKKQRIMIDYDGDDPIFFCYAFCLIGVLTEMFAGFIMTHIIENKKEKDYDDCVTMYHHLVRSFFIGVIAMVIFVCAHELLNLVKRAVEIPLTIVSVLIKHPAEQFAAKVDHYIHSEMDKHAKDVTEMVEKRLKDLTEMVTEKLKDRVEDQTVILSEDPF
jgi:hypothetical protein